MMNYPTPTKIAGSNPADPPYPPRPYFPTLGTTLHNSAGAIGRENCWGRNIHASLSLHPLLVGAPT